MALLNGLGVSCFKVASALLPEPALLRAIAATGKPMLLSTGMATLAEVDEAVSVVKKANNDQVILLHCTTDYPALVEEANLLAMVTMGNAFGLPVGYSDHTATGTACIAAVALGACVIERHFTLDREQPGPDHACSDDPAQFAILVRRIRECELALGDGRKNPGPNECRNARGMRRGLVTRKDIRPGETLDEDVLTSKRPAVGLSPRDFDQVVGLRARVAITADQPLYWWMLDKPEN